MQLEGTWYVVATNFPMWTKGRRTHPRFIYSNSRTVNGRAVMDDTVAYSEGGREKTIVGVDTQVSQGSQAWVWRGKGLFTLFTSRWEIVAVAEDEQSLALAFTRTLFTPAGMDLIARTPTLDDAAYQAWLARLGGPVLIRL